MTNYRAVVTRCLLLVLGFAAACTLTEESAQKKPPVGFIVTPPASYTTQKGRYLGERYQRNLERLVQQLVENPATRNLQFANNIVSVGGIGFFSHSATRSQDERYLEVILGLPELLDARADFSRKVRQVFSQYGFELLSILASDSEVFNDKEVAGFGLNFSWRSTSDRPSGQRVVLERAVVYFQKAEARSFLAGRFTQEQLLAGAVGFSIQGEGVATQFYYASEASGSDARPVEAKSADTPKLPQPQAKIREADLQEIPSEKQKEDRVSPPQLPLVKAPRLADPQIETKERPNSNVSQLSAKREPTNERPQTKVAEVKKKELPSLGEGAKQEQKSPTAGPSPDTTPRPQSSPAAEKPAAKPEPIFPKEMKDASHTKESAIASQGGVVKDTPLQSPNVDLKTTTPSSTSLAKPERAIPENVVAPTIPGAQKQTAVSNDSKAREVKADRNDLDTRAKTSGNAATQSAQGTTEQMAKAAEPKVAPPVVAGRSEPKVTGLPSVERDGKVKKSSGASEPKEFSTSNPQDQTGELKTKLPPPAVIETPKEQKPGSTKSVAELPTVTKQPTVSKESTLQESRLNDGKNADSSPNARQKTLKEEVQKTPLRQESDTIVSLNKRAEIPPPKDIQDARQPAPKADIQGERALPSGTEKPRDERAAKTAESQPSIAPKQPHLTHSLGDPKQPESGGKSVDQLALNKIPPPSQVARPRVEALRDYIVQLSFKERAEADRWALLLKQEGFAIVINVGGDGQPVRVRVGSFSSSTEAKNALERFQKKGLTGLVVQLPKT